MPEVINLGGSEADRRDELEDLRQAEEEEEALLGETSITRMRNSIMRTHNDNDDGEQADGEEGSNVVPELNGAAGSNVVKKRKKRSIPKFSLELVCDENKGIYKVHRDLLKFEARGKGYEVSDLRKLLEYYRQWLHDLYPRESFAQLVQRLQKLSRDGVKVHLRKLRDEQVKNSGGINRASTNILDDEEVQKRAEENRLRALELLKQRQELDMLRKKSSKPTTSVARPANPTTTGTRTQQTEQAQREIVELDQGHELDQPVEEDEYDFADEEEALRELEADQHAMQVSQEEEDLAREMH